MIIIKVFIIPILLIFVKFRRLSVFALGVDTPDDQSLTALTNYQRDRHTPLTLHQAGYLAHSDHHLQLLGRKYLHRQRRFNRPKIPICMVLAYCGT
jgi:hypothetical protein